MIGLLEDVVGIFENIPAYILYAVESAWNLIVSGIDSLWSLITSLIPLPEVPGAPTFVANLNWFFPIGSIVSIMAPIVVGYISFLLVRYIYSKVGDL
jgi:hypothetical protein